MLEIIEWKTVAAIAASVCSILGFAPYIWQICQGKTKPHIYTWIIWTITIGIACAGMWTGGAGLILSVAMVINTLLAFSVVLLCLKFGTTNITRSDAVALFAALCAIVIWIGLDNPVLALILATSIDLIGYWPTYRKSFSEPWTENILAWVIYVLAPAFTLLAVLEYNALTVTYSIATLVANSVLVAFLVLRRQSVPKPV